MYINKYYFDELKNRGIFKAAWINPSTRHSNCFILFMILYRKEFIFGCEKAQSSYVKQILMILLIKIFVFKCKFQACKLNIF